jgi:hypothetical protein
VRVVRTVESPDPDVAGMHVRAIGESDVVAFEFIPAPVPMLDPPRSEPATPVVEIDAQMSAPEESVTAAAPAEAAVAETGVAQAAQAAQAAQPAIDEQAQATSTLAADSEASVAVEATSSAATASEAVPEAVPTAVGSSLTGALANATDSVASASGAVSSEAVGDSSTSSGTASTEDLPPARPISGSNGRRKTKRRK